MSTVFQSRGYCALECVVCGPTTASEGRSFDTPNDDTALSYTLDVPADPDAIPEENDRPEIDIVFGTNVGTVGTVRAEDVAHAIFNENGDIAGVDPGAAGANVILAGPLRLGAEHIGKVDQGEKKVYFEFSDYSTQYVFYEDPNG